MHDSKHQFTLTTSEALVVYHLRDIPHPQEQCTMCEATAWLNASRALARLSLAAGVRTEEDSFIAGFEIGTLVALPDKS